VVRGSAAAVLQTADYSAEGWKALEAQKYEEAAGLFTKAAEADPKAMPRISTWRWR